MHHFQKTKTMSTVLVKDAWLPTPQNAKYMKMQLQELVFKSLQGANMEET